MEFEREVKLLGIDLDELEQKLISNGAVLLTKEYQENILIDSTTHPVKNFSDSYMRIRVNKDLVKNTTKNIYTLKERVFTESGIRESVEHSILIEDVNGLLEILNKLGYDLVERGYKDRTSYILDNCRIDLDTWDKETYPYPYAEVEVQDKGSIEKLLKKLNIDERHISTKSIKQLKDELVNK
ncbi:MAG: class IV adenylate cyclase [Tissierellia bacterium]|nr:class IV adenylate cyclase [Tissierellia bacterium]